MKNSVSLTLFCIIVWVLPLDARGQIDLRKYFTGDIIPSVQPTEYPDIEIKWDMPGPVQAALNTGMTELKENNYRVAIPHFKDVMRQDRNSEPAFYYRAIAYKSLFQLDSAISDFTKAFRIRKSWQAAEQLGEAYLLAGDGVNAEEWFLKASKINPQNVLPVYHLAELESKRGNMDAAMSLFEKCHQLDPKFAPAYVLQGLVVQHQNKGKLNNSLPYFKLAVEADSTSKLGLFWRGVTYATLNKTAESLADFDKLVSSNPRTPFFLLLRGFLNIELYRYEIAFNDLRKAILFTSTSEDTFKGGQTLLDKQLDIQYATQYAMRFSYGLDPDALNHFRKGFCFLLADRKSEALKSFRNAEIFQPSAAVFLMKAITLEHSGLHNEALAAYTKALELDNDIFDAHKKRAIYRTELKDYDGALEDFKEMIRLEPSLMQTYRLRGFTRMHQPDFNGAIEDLTKYSKSDSTDSEVWLNIAYANEQIKNFPEAGRNYLVAARVAKLPEYYGMAFNAFINSGDTTQLLKGFDVYAKDFPFEPDPLHKRARIYIAQKEWKKAKVEIDRSIGMTEANQMLRQLSSVSYLLKGLLLVEQKNPKEALTWFTKAKAADPANHEADFLYARALSELGDVKKALKILEDLKMKNYPDAEKAYQLLLTKSKG